MISAEQCRAARAMLAWKQSELAKAAAVSVTAVNYFERGMGAARPDTVGALENAFEAADIEFLSGGGVRRLRDHFQFLNHQGADFVARLNADMYRALSKGNMEIVTCSADEKAWRKFAATSNREYCAFARSKKISERILVRVGTAYINNPDVTYRVLPDHLIGTVTYTIYADRIAYLLWPQRRVVVLRNSDLTAGLLAQFDFLWAQAKALRK